MKKTNLFPILFAIASILLFAAVMPQSCYAGSGVKINKSKATILVSKSVNLSVKGTTSKAQWSSSDQSIAKVSSKGKVTGKKAGKAVITAKVGSNILTCKVTVKIGLDKKNVSMEVGGTTKVKLCGTKIKKVQSADEKVASVSKKGVITAVGKGKTTITFTGKNKKKYKCKVTVIGKSNTPTPTPKPNPVVQKTYTVTFDSNGGTAVPSQTVKEGGKASVPAAPSRDGYTFDHWEQNGAVFNFSTPIKSNITLVAKWTKSAWENAKEVKQIIDAPASPSVETESQALQSLTDRGFLDYPVIYNFTIKGEFCDDTEAQASSSNKRPMYSTFFISSNGAVWSIYSINGDIIAYPVSYMLGTGSEKAVFISEKEEITSYDGMTNRFYVTIPDPEKVTVIVVNKIDADTLNLISRAALGTS